MPKIYNTNTQSFDSLVEQVVSKSIPILAPAVPLCTAYCTLIPVGPIVGGKANVPVLTNIQSVQTNPTTFENSGDSLANKQTTFVAYSAQFGLSNPESAQGLDITMLLASHLTQIQNSLQAAINAQITEANFASAVVTASSSAYSLANCETLTAAVPGRAILALAPDYFVKTKNTWLPSGEEGVLKELSYTSGIGTNIVGFSARQEAIALCVGYPLSGPGDNLKTSFIKLPIGLEVAFSRWYKRSGREWRGSLDICLAPAVGAAGALRVIKSA